MSVFVNRILNMKKIKAIGFDMDYTLVRYNAEAFEQLSHKKAVEKLISVLHYPKSILDLPWDFNLAIQGLVLDKKRGNLLKVSRYGKVKTAYHGSKQLNYSEMQQVYANRVIDLNDENMQSMDTSFSLSNGILVSQLVELKEQGLDLPDFDTIANDVRSMIDLCHRDDTLKGEVRKDVKKYIIQDPEMPMLLLRLKQYQKKLLVITNSDYEYTRLLLDYTINPFLKNGETWGELFDVVITLSKKPRFFTESNPFLKIETDTGFLKNHHGQVTNGIFQGGNAGDLQDQLGLSGEEILYLGDHIYGDVVTIKKTFNWRTALVLDPLGQEVESIHASRKVQDEIDRLMQAKEDLETKLNEVEFKKRSEEGGDPKEIQKTYAEIDRINTRISELLGEFKKYFNPYWGEMMRAGQEESRFADQVEKYACVYMTKVTDLLNYSPKTYFRPVKRILPHEIV